MLDSSAINERQYSIQYQVLHPLDKIYLIIEMEGGQNL